MAHNYNCRETELTPIPRYSLRLVENIGSCHAGEVRRRFVSTSPGANFEDGSQISLYETEGLEDIIPDIGRLVVARTPSSDRAKGDAAASPMESLREVRFLASLSDPNICRVLGVCTAEQPPWIVIEYGDMGDLAQYLQFLADRNEAVRPSTELPLRYERKVHECNFSGTSSRIVPVRV